MTALTTIPGRDGASTYPAGRPVDRWEDGRPVRDCRCPVARHEHGVNGAYVTDRCRCRLCRGAHASTRRAWRRRRAYGRQVPKSVSAVGSRRRLEALATLGWSWVELSRRLGWSPDRLNKVFQGGGAKGISPGNAARIAALYDELWDRRPPMVTADQRMGVSRTRNWARRRGFAPPLAWDEDTIDDPDALPSTVVTLGPVCRDLDCGHRSCRQACPAMAPQFDGEPLDAPGQGSGMDGPVFVDEIAVERLMAGTLAPPPARGRTRHAPETIEAVRRLAALRFSDAEIGKRLGKETSAVNQIRNRYGIAAGVGCTRPNYASDVA